MQSDFFIEKEYVHTVLGIPFLEDKDIRLEFSHKQGEIISYQELDGRILCMPLFKPQEIEWKTGPPSGMDLCNMGKLARNTPGEKLPNAKRENTIINLVYKTQELAISPKMDEFYQKLQNTKRPNNLKKNPEDFSSEDELPRIIYKQITNNEETFQILVDRNEKINVNPSKTKQQRQTVRFSQHHELSDEEIIYEIEKYF
ncbi:hypothetical protein O181_003934 [Austropuccinia psidii MF-1]|uniref:Uncharacterized protein n=1 Tax=Austropuccinia psidii MF-1 TaxID=1389203 RepID=A0A9Q3BEX3_9BASI|nr:hypothetical protein [Austropuccinia psidii MF-1]